MELRRSGVGTLLFRGSRLAGLKKVDAGHREPKLKKPMFPETNLAFVLLKITGSTNLLFFVLIFFSCRCLGAGRLINYLSRYAWYKKFYRLHCYYWWLLFFSVLLHTLLATYLFGLGF